MSQTGGRGLPCDFDSQAFDLAVRARAQQRHIKGSVVRSDEVLLVLEALKMEIPQDTIDEGYGRGL